MKLVSKRFIPEDRGRIVTAFMENYFNQYVQYDYTANLENKLDDITNGSLKWKAVLSEFWKTFDSTVKSVEPYKMGEVLETVAKTLEKQMFPTDESRICPECKTGRLSLKVGRFGAFIGCSNYPKCNYTKQFATIDAPRDENGEPIEESAEKQVYELGKNEAGQDISVRHGPYGWYVQAGIGKDAKRTGLPKGVKPETVDIQKALGLLSLPRLLGKDPQTGEAIEAGLGKFGPYVRRGKTYKSLMPTDDVLTIELPRAQELLSEKAEEKKVKKLGKWNGEEVTYQVGRYGPYVKCGKIMASVKKKDEIPALEEAISLLQEKMRQK